MGGRGSKGKSKGGGGSTSGYSTKEEAQKEALKMLDEARQSRRERYARGETISPTDSDATVNPTIMYKNGKYQVAKNSDEAQYARSKGWKTIY